MVHRSEWLKKHPKVFRILPQTFYPFQRYLLRKESLLAKEEVSRMGKELIIINLQSILSNNA